MPLQLGMLPVAGLSVVPAEDANRLLVAWGHELGPIMRPFGSQSWVLAIDDEPVSVAVSVSTVSEHVSWTEVRTDGDGDDTEVIAEKRTMHRDQLVELGRLCSREPWANRVMLRLWREVAAPRWPYWTPSAAVSYSLNARHDGQLYRFDGWTKARDDCGSSGGGAWSRKRYATEAVHGRKTLWLWRY